MWSGQVQKSARAHLRVTVPIWSFVGTDRVKWCRAKTIYCDFETDTGNTTKCGSLKVVKCTLHLFIGLYCGLTSLITSLHAILRYY